MSLTRELEGDDWTDNFRFRSSDEALKARFFHGKSCKRVKKRLLKVAGKAMVKVVKKQNYVDNLVEDAASLFNNDATNSSRSRDITADEMEDQITHLLETSKGLNQFTSIPAWSCVLVVPDECEGGRGIIKAEGIKDAAREELQDMADFAQFIANPAYGLTDDVFTCANSPALWPADWC